MTQNFGPEDGHYMVTGVNEQTRNGHYMVTGATERHDMATGVQRERESLCRRDLVTGATKEIGKRHDMTGVHEEVTYCSPCISSGKQKKNRSTVNRNSAVRTPLRRSKQTKFC